MKKYKIIVAVSVILFLSCNKYKNIKIVKAFYYWKSENRTLTNNEEELIKQVSPQKLYIKFFDVVNNSFNLVEPIAKTNLNLNYAFNNYNNDSVLSKIGSSLSIIPTVYIKNNVFYNLNDSSINELYKNILFLIEKRFHENYSNQFPNYQEIQIDCDWTEKTKTKYFIFLEKLKEQTDKVVSVTLRLYPYKYREKMGIPPVDKAMLMCYNLLPPLENNNKNSILDVKELESYLKVGNSYPLHLDIALPVFEWYHVYRNNQLVGFIHQIDDVNLIDSAKLLKPMWYQIQKDIEVGSLFLRIGDIIKKEETNQDDIEKTIFLLKKYLKFKGDLTVTLFHLDNQILKKYNAKEISTFYTNFNN